MANINLSYVGENTDYYKASERRLYVVNQKKGINDMESITLKHLYDKFGEELSKEFESCMYDKTEINIFEDTVFRFENEMQKEGRTIRSKFFSLRDEAEVKELGKYMLATDRDNHIFFIVSGLRFPRVYSIIRDLIPDKDQDIEFAMVRRNGSNRLVVLSY